MDNPEIKLPFGNDLNQYAKFIHETAVQQGYWDEGHTFHYTMSNSIAELGEALSEYRDENPVLYYRDVNGNKTVDIQAAHDEDKPYGLGVEIVDSLIWLLDYLVFLGVDIDDVMRRKVRYNATRGYLHGHKKA